MFKSRGSIGRRVGIEGRLKRRLNCLEGFGTACCHLLYQRWSLGRQGLLRVRAIVYSALQNYNDFAEKFGGHFAHDRIYWERDIVLNDGSKLRIRGLNSAIG